MQKIPIFGTGIVVFLILIIGKGLDGQESAPPLSKPINIVVILDTSDRVSQEENPVQLERDVVIMKGIADLFCEHLLDEIRTQLRNAWLRHFLTFVVPEQAEATLIPQGIFEKLRIRPTDDDRRRGSAAWVKDREDELFSGIDELYQLVENQERFTGSDIWRWFQASAELYLEEDMQNYIICLSDGYLDFNRSIQVRRPQGTYIPYHQVRAFREDPNWEQTFDSEGHGLLDTGQDFSAYDVKFLMVEMKYREDYMLDLPILKKYWRTWLESMGINASFFLDSQSDSGAVRKKITAFTSLNR